MSKGPAPYPKTEEPEQERGIPITESNEGPSMASACSHPPWQASHLTSFRRHCSHTSPTGPGAVARPWRAGQELAGRRGQVCSVCRARQCQVPTQVGPGEGHSRFSQLLPTPPAGGREGEAGALPGRGWRLHTTRVQGQQWGLPAVPRVATAA